MTPASGTPIVTRPPAQRLLWLSCIVLSWLLLTSAAGWVAYGEEMPAAPPEVPTVSAPVSPSGSVTSTHGQERRQRRGGYQYDARSRRGAGLTQASTGSAAVKTSSHGSQRVERSRPAARVNAAAQPGRGKQAQIVTPSDKGRQPHRLSQTPPVSAQKPVLPAMKPVPVVKEKTATGHPVAVHPGAGSHPVAAHPAKVKKTGPVAGEHSVAAHPVRSHKPQVVDESRQPLRSVVRTALRSPAQKPTAGAGGPNWSQIVLSLLGVLGLAFVVLKGLLPKVMTSTNGLLVGAGEKGSSPLQLVSSLSLGPNQWLRIVRVGSQTLLISQTAEQISLIKVCEDLTTESSTESTVARPAAVSVLTPAEFDEVQLKDYDDRLLMSA